MKIELIKEEEVKELMSNSRSGFDTQRFKKDLMETIEQLIAKNKLSNGSYYTRIPYDEIAKYKKNFSAIKYKWVRTLEEIKVKENGIEIIELRRIGSWKDPTGILVNFKVLKEK